jgi:diaminohydroxyphosphoribosylaminopyrimidine deaminase/5-amino-6-(5-phosphoribosylamino)uracil reductase
MENIDYMKRALELAKKGWGRTKPNPLVGAVIVKNDKIIGEGYHEKLGESHAEVNAIRSSIEDCKGAELYINLEPCSHYGKTPPCVYRIIESKIKKVVVAMADPNPRVSGKGISILRDNGIEVEVGVLKEEALRLNDIFINYITNKTPLVLLKWAMTADGKTATKTGDSKWISSHLSREYVHKLRNRYSSILVGINTVMKDNPELTSRSMDMENINPIRIVLDRFGRIPLSAKILDADESKPTIVATSEKMERDKRKKLSEMGVKVLILDENNGTLNLKTLIEELYKQEIDSILVEGGGTVASSFLEADLVDKIAAFIGPVIIGGKDAKTPIMGNGVNSIKDGFKIQLPEFQRFEDDILIEGYIKLPWG